MTIAMLALLASCSGGQGGSSQSQQAQSQNQTQTQIQTQTQTQPQNEEQSQAAAGGAEASAQDSSISTETATFRVGKIQDITQQEEEKPSYTFTQPDTYERALKADLAPYGESYAKMKKECVDGDSHNCVTLGRAFFAGWGVPVDRKLGFSFFAKGCDNVDNESCRLLAMAYFLGYGIERNIEVGEWRMEDSCHSGNGPACTAIVQMYDKDENVPENPVLGKEIWKLSKLPYDKDWVDHFVQMEIWTHDYTESNTSTDCHNGENHGCYFQAKYYIENNKKLDEAQKLLEKSCNENKFPMGCALLAEKFEKDPAKKVAALKKSCDDGYLESCELSCNLAEGEDAQNACRVDLCERKKFSDSCEIAGKALADKDTDKALELAKKSCDLKNRDGCNLASELFKKKGDAKSSQEYIVKAAQVEGTSYFK